MTTRAIIFDFGGVLAVPRDPGDWDAHRDQMAVELGFESRHEMWPYIFAGNEWLRAKTGQITDDEFWQILLEPLGLKTRQTRRAWVERLYGPAGGIHPRMRQMLTRLQQQKRHMLALLSNASDELENSLDTRHHIKYFFDHVIVSATVGLAKPDPAIYKLTLERLGLPAAETLFIDDQARNTQAAARIGIPSIVFLGVDALWAELEKRGIL